MKKKRLLEKIDECQRAILELHGAITQAERRLAELEKKEQIMDRWYCGLKECRDRKRDKECLP